MAKTLRSRLWLGYLLLTILVLGAFLLGLVYILNGSTVLYRQVVSKLDNTEQLLLEAKNTPSPVGIEKIKSILNETPLESSIRVMITSNLGEILYDNQQDEGARLRWVRVAALKRVAAQGSSGLTRDSLRRVWIYVATKMPDSQNYLVIASLRQNITWKFMFSDPMTRLVLRVVIWSMLVSLFLTFLMDRWITLPIRKMSQQAALIASEKGTQLPVDGVKEVKDLALALNQMSRQVQESKQSQRDFISDVSHELKTPLTSIQGFSAAILDGTASTHDEINHSAEIISIESQRMLGMVNELLALARLEGKVEKIEYQQINLQALLNGVIEKLTPSAHQGQVSLKLTLSELPLIEVDPEGITRIFLNLIVNAIKFSPPASEVIISGDTSSAEVIIHVIDNGQGIPAEELPKIFNRFYQVDRSRKGGMGKSSGLGLTIAREIARSHHGDITVQSTEGQGTTFSVHLPLYLRHAN
jgi:signal transduction histidine kinase